MAQFEVYRLASGTMVLDCQADELAQLPTRFVVPLLDPGSVPNQIKTLHPIFDFAGERVLMATHAASAIGHKHLSAPLGSLAEQRYIITNALDFLITGV